MKMRLLAVALFCGLLLRSVPAQTVTAGEAEAQKCEDRIAAVQRDVLNKYDDAMAELQLTLQKAADLEGAVAVRAERQRVAHEQSLAELNFVTEPKSLRALQTQMFGKMQDLIAQLIAETVPKLVELKKQLTVAGKLDEALAVRGSIEKLQNGYLPMALPDPTATVPAETLLLAYSGDRVRADKIYKAQTITVHGMVGAFRQDPGDSKTYQVFVTGAGATGWVQCNFRAGENRFREEKGSYNVPVLVIGTKDGDAARVQKGAMLDVRGVCEGWDEVVRLTKCEVAK